jgi:hypothetical protein
VVGEQESHGRFIGGFRWHDVPFISTAIDQREHRRLVVAVRSSTVCGQATRARRDVCEADEIYVTAGEKGIEDEDSSPRYSRR